MTGKSVHIIGTRGYPSYYGGFETLVRQLAPHLADQGWAVTVYGRGRTSDSGTNVGDPRVKTVDTRGLETRSLSTLSYGLTSSSRCAVTKPDVALVMNVANGFWLPLLRARNIPSLVNVDGIEWERQKWGSAAKKLFREGAKATARYADDLVFDSKALGDRWENDFGRSGIYIPYGGSFGGGRTPLDGLERRKYVLMVARFVPENTVLEFLDAVNRLSKKHDVVIVGSSGYGGDIDNRVHDLARQSDRIRWYGHVSNDEVLFSLWENCGAYFHGHSVGGTNPALVQAMALGAPIVARDTVYNSEVLETAGVLVAPESSEIFRVIDDLMSDGPRQESLSRLAVERARSAFTWDLVCQGYTDALTSVMSTRAALL